MAKFDAEMPAAAAGEEEELYDLGVDDAPEEEGGGMDLSSYSDDDLVAELEKRGFEVEDEESGEEAPEEEAPEEEPTEDEDSLF